MLAIVVSDLTSTDMPLCLLDTVFTLQLIKYSMMGRNMQK